MTPDPRVERQLVFATNTPVHVVIEEDISKAIYDSIPAEEISGAGLPLHVYLTLEGRNPEGGYNLVLLRMVAFLGARNTFAFSPGRYTETISWDTAGMHIPFPELLQTVLGMIMLGGLLRARTTPVS